MKTFFTADTHFNCPRLVRLTRPWIPVEEHDQYVLDCINSRVGVRDRLIIVGDFCKGKPFKWRQKIRCKNIWFVRGNHDVPITAYQQCFGVDRFRDIYDLKIEGHKVTACHFPMVHWNCSHYGSFHVYGHVHGAKEAELNLHFPNRRSIDVGVDNAYKWFGSPVPFPDLFLIDYFLERPGHGIIVR